MITTLFPQSSLITRFSDSPAGPYLTTLGNLLQQEGYHIETVRNCLSNADKFCCWMKQLGLTVGDASEGLVRRYGASLPRRYLPKSPRGRAPKETAGLSHLLRVLRREAVIQPLRTSSPITASDTWLARYASYLELAVGAAWSTRRKCLHYIRRFIHFRFADKDPDWSLLSGDHLAGFVIQQTQCGYGAAKTAASAVRSFLRFLVSEGALRPGLEAAVPPLRRFRLSNLPRYLTTEQVEQVLNTCRGASSKERRNLAVLLLLSRLGLRAEEVAGLQLDDFNWCEGTLRIRSAKSLRERLLPLSSEVGGAVVDYLQLARPRNTHRFVFLQCHAPFAPLRNTAIGHIARFALQQARLVIPRPGAHVFRHTVATQMVRRGATLPQIADVLGHVDFESTALYAKLDLPTLSQVALPWPGGCK
jgi:integrase